MCDVFTPPEPVEIAPKCPGTDCPLVVGGDAVRGGVVILSGKVASGRGLAGGHIGEVLDELQIRLGERPVVGTLNVLLEGPLKLKQECGIQFAGDERMVWPARLNGLAVWLYRWRSAPLHAAELISPVSLRDSLGLVDGSDVAIEVDSTFVERPPALSWTLLWKGREDWAYTRRRYAKAMSRLARWTGLGLGTTRASLARSVRRKLGRDRFEFIRAEGHAAEVQALNLLGYTKTSGSSYSARRFPAGYHTIQFDGLTLRGQRDPLARLELVPFDFTGKTVLDIGSNQGGMLLALTDKLKWGVGVDYDYRLVNAANRISRIKGAANLDFYVFDLERENLRLIRDYLPGKRADLCFLLSVCMWLKNWREVVDFAASVSEAVLFESNGSDQQQDEQIAYLKSVCRSIEMLAEESADDPGQKRRRLVLGRT